MIKTGWITLVNIAVLLNACTATAAESTGVSVLTEVLDLVLDKTFNFEHVSECVNQSSEETGTIEMVEMNET